MSNYSVHECNFFINHYEFLLDMPSSEEARKYRTKELLLWQERLIEANNYLKIKN